MTVRCGTGVAGLGVCGALTVAVRDFKAYPLYDVRFKSTTVYKRYMFKSLRDML